MTLPADPRARARRIERERRKRGTDTLKWDLVTREWVPKTPEERIEQAKRDYERHGPDVEEDPELANAETQREKLQAAFEEEMEALQPTLESTMPDLFTPINNRRHSRFQWPGGPRPPWWERQPEAYQQRDETEAEWETRMTNFMGLIARVDRARGWPRAVELAQFLGEDHPLSEKKQKVEAYLAWARDFTAPRPPSEIHGRMIIIWPGCSIGSLPSVQALKRDERWKQYQRDLRAASEERRAPRPHRDRSEEKKVYRAEKWLDSAESKIIEASANPKRLATLMVQVRKRIDLLPPELAEKYTRLIR